MYPAGQGIEPATFHLPTHKLTPLTFRPQLSRCFESLSLVVTLLSAALQRLTLPAQTSDTPERTWWSERGERSTCSMFVTVMDQKSNWNQTSTDEPNDHVQATEEPSVLRFVFSWSQFYWPHVLTAVHLCFSSSNCSNWFPVRFKLGTYVSCCFHVHNNIINNIFH